MPQIIKHKETTVEIRNLIQLLPLAVGAELVEMMLLTNKVTMEVREAVQELNVREVMRMQAVKL